MMKRVLFFSCALMLVACHIDDGLHTDPGGSLTWYSAIPAPSGTGLGLVIEPVLDQTAGEGVLVTGFSLTDVGPTIVVDARAGGPPHALASLGTGITKVRLGPQAAFILQSSTASWASRGPSIDPPPVTFSHVTRLDRTSLAITGARDLEPPAESAIAFDDHVIVDMPRTGASDAERDVFVRLYDVDGDAAPTVLHTARGFGAASCSGAGGVALAYEPASQPGSTVLVSARFIAGKWQTAEATLESVRLDPTAIACSKDGSRVLVSVLESTSQRSHVELVDVPSKALVIDALDLQGPFAVTQDGSAFVATTVADRSLSWHDATRSRAAVRSKSLAATSSGDNPILTGDLALWFVQDGVALVHLTDGTIEPPLGLETTAIDYELTGPPVAWTSGGGFVVPVTADDEATYSYDLVRLLLVRPGRTDTLPLGLARGTPQLVTAGNTLYVTANAGSIAGKTSLLTYDLASLALSSETPFVTCDRATILAKNGCLP